MEKIKVGQIWKERNGLSIVVTKENKDTSYDYIFSNGSTVSQDDAFFIRENRDLVGEYRTWQEAVNSDLFLDEMGVEDD